MKEKEIIFTAKVLSVLFTPFYLPILGLLILFIFSYLSLLPLTYKLFLLLMFYLFTVFLPTALIRFYRRYQGWTLIELGSRERRAIPYVISNFFLSSVLLHNGCHPCAPLHGEHPYSSPCDTGGLRHHKSFHQDIHPYGSHRRRYRCVAGLFQLYFRSIRCGGSALCCCSPVW